MSQNPACRRAGKRLLITRFLELARCAERGSYRFLGYPYIVRMSACIFIICTECFVFCKVMPHNKRQELKVHTLALPDLLHENGPVDSEAEGHCSPEAEGRW